MAYLPSRRLTLSPWDVVTTPDPSSGLPFSQEATTMDPEDLRFDTRSAIEALTARVRAEFDESPGLRITEQQLRRLFGLDPETCPGILEALVRSGFLFRDSPGRYSKK